MLVNESQASSSISNEKFPRMPYQSQSLDQPKQGWCTKENFGAVSICALSMIVIGILMMIGGGTLSFVYYTEITPPNYDAYYQRYVGSSLPRILGKYFPETS